MINKPEIETLSYEPKCDCIACQEETIEQPKGLMKIFLPPLEQPNQDLMIIEEIEGLISQVNEKINKLSSEDVSRLSYQLRNQALEEIDLFQKTTLFELRKAFE